MKNIAITVLAALIFAGCNAQTDKKTEGKKDEIKPKIDYQVNKEYDENGNLIKMDSTYTYYYSNIDKDAMLKDSVLQKFYKHFNMNKPFTDNFFNDKVFNEDDFFNEDFFRGSFMKHQEMMNKMMREMDSLKNKFFIEEYPLKENTEADKNKS